MAFIKSPELLQKYIELSVNNKKFVVFDIETTGLKVLEGDKITQISAIKIENGKIIGKFSEYVNPEQKLSKKIIELTGITDEILQDKETIEKVLPRFLDFVGDCIVVAHNGSFDVGFIEFFAFDVQREFNNELIDTVELARYLFPKSKNHKLDTLCTLLNVVQLQHHNADDDTRVLMECFVLMRKLLLKEKGIDEDKPLFTINKIQKNHIKSIIMVYTSIGSLGYDLANKRWLKGKDVTIQLTTKEIEENLLKNIRKCKTMDDFILFYK